MTTTEILDEIIKNFSNIPTTENLSVMIKAQQKSFQDSENLLKKELSALYNKGYEDATKFWKDQAVKNQIKNN